MTPTLDLFAVSADSTRNLLPGDGEVYDHGRIYDEEEAQKLFSLLLQEVAWEHDELVIAGKRVVTARKVAWHGDREEAYRYSGATKMARPWTPTLQSVKQRVELAVGCAFNSCLLNLYASGEEGMGWHSDDEVELGTTPTIASLSFGAQRRFDFRRRADRHKVSLYLNSGQLLVMAGSTQTHWEHTLPRTKRVRAARINLTFRTIRTVLGNSVGGR